AKGISTWASVKSAVRISADFSWRQQRMHAALQQTEDLERQGLLLALGFGERAWLKTEHWQMYQQTNTVHLLAISGLHIGLAMACGFMLMRGVQFFMPTIRITPWLPVLGGFCLAYGYAELAGFSIPTFRAITALAILSALRLCRVYCTAWQLFIRVIALLLLCEPLMVLSASFWLSIGAVACLIIWYQVFPLSLLEWRGKPFPAKVRWILALFHLQLGLLWLFMPVQLAVFNGFSAYGFWANLITVPLFSFILVPIVLFAVLTQGALSSWQIADFLAAKIEWVLSWLQGGWVNVSEKTALMLTAILLTAFLGLMKWIYRHRSKVQGQWKKRNKGFALKSERNLPLHWQRRVMYVGSVGIVFCILMLMLPHINRPNWRLETLDVGQGLAILIIKNEQALLYDTGAGWQGGSMAKIEVIPYLRRQGIQLDHLIL
ncbi:MAG TPA: DNA internalization-related competence protein ComEC/Rec2, partial [Pasteurellaceae bacterium]|nr:DNA internalization-related competence protein ComEC/Rec2 [Pasteurellaceae bacterium]